MQAQRFNLSSLVSLKSEVSPVIMILSLINAVGLAKLFHIVQQIYNKSPKINIFNTFFASLFKRVVRKLGNLFCIYRLGDVHHAALVHMWRLRMVRLFHPALLWLVFRYIFAQIGKFGTAFFWAFHETQLSFMSCRTFISTYYDFVKTVWKLLSFPVILLNVSTW